MDNLVSIIVPIYNVEKYLNRCVDSLVNQTYANIEIILVDDGSTDGCPDLCDAWAKKDDRIKVIHKKNGGLSDARNCGIDAGTGQMIAFVDSDDYVAENYIELLCKPLKENCADISICGRELVFDGKCKTGRIPCNGLKEYSSYDAIVETLNVRLPQSAWGKLYRRSLFKDIRFPIGKLYEDLAIVYDILLLTKKIIYVDAPAYYYFIRPDSIMHLGFNMKQAAEIEIIDRAMDEVTSAYGGLKTLTNARRIYSYFVVLRRIMLCPDPDEYLSLRQELKQKIYQASKGVIFSPQVKMSIKIKLLAYKFGEKSYMFFQKIADRFNPEVI